MACLPIHVFRAGSATDPEVVEGSGPYPEGDIVMERIDRQHGLVRYWFTRDARQADCPACQAGTCIQRVESCGEWEAQVVVHECERD